MIYKFVKRLIDMNINARVVEDDSKIYDDLITFPEVCVPEAMFLIGKVKDNKLTIHCRIGMEGEEIEFGEIQDVDESKLAYLEEMYFRMKRISEM